MPRAQGDKMSEAEELFKNGMAMSDIAKKIGVSAATVRSWKSRGWGKGKPKAREVKDVANVAKDVANKNATPNRKKVGAPYGNKNAVGASGNPHASRPTVHGAYESVRWGNMSDEDWQVLESMPDDDDLLLQEQIQLCAIRERRILKAIALFQKEGKDPSRLEQELTSVQRNKTRMIEAHSRLQIEKQKTEKGSTGNAEVNDWINAVMGELENDGQ